MKVYPEIPLTDEEEDKLTDEDFMSHDYVELPDGRRGHITGWYEGFRPSGECSDTIGFEVMVDKSYGGNFQERRVKVFYYQPYEPDIMFDGIAQARKYIKIIRHRGRWEAPWTNEQVDKAIAYRNYHEEKIKDPIYNPYKNISHQFKCPNNKMHEEKYSDRPAMIITNTMLYCLDCDYTQNWIEDWIFQWTKS